MEDNPFLPADEAKRRRDAQGRRLFVLVASICVVVGVALVGVLIGLFWWVDWFIGRQ